MTSVRNDIAEAAVQARLSTWNNGPKKIQLAGLDDMSAQIVIRSTARQAYLAEDGKWSPHISKARTFDSALQAEKVCREERLRDAEIMVMRHSRTPMRIAIRPRREE